MRRPRKLSEFEKFQWAVFLTACVVFFIWYYILGFFQNCIFEWPVRWDVKTCWNEQYEPARDKAAEKAINFMP